MDFSLDWGTIGTIVSLLLGGGGIGTWLTWKYTRRKEEAEAGSAEMDAAAKMQDMYQQMIADVKADRDEQKAYISELKDDRRNLRVERDELCARIDKTDEMVRELQAQVARNGRMVESMRPFMCGDLNCSHRQRVAISPDGELKKTKRTKTTEA